MGCVFGYLKTEKENSAQGTAMHHGGGDVYLGFRQTLASNLQSRAGAVRHIMWLPGCLVGTLGGWKRTSPSGWVRLDVDGETRGMRICSKGI